MPRVHRTVCTFWGTFTTPVLVNRDESWLRSIARYGVINKGEFGADGRVAEGPAAERNALDTERSTKLWRF
jgi:hypothetical protein